MGVDIDRIEFDDNDYRQFQLTLSEQLLLLKKTLANPNFGNTPPSIGAELELYIIDKQGKPLPKNEQLLSLAQNSQLTPELNSYNIEYNTPPCPTSRSPFHTLENKIVDELQSLNQHASTLNARIVPIGILPTLTPSDFGPHCMTQRKRYHALVSQLIRQRGGDFEIDIDGKSPLKFNLADITLEGANTSFQIHHQVSPKHYADTYNALQLMTPLAIAIGANSPTLFGHYLWDETRIPLFKQSIDTRHLDRYEWNEPARVNFGHGWLREGAYELFSESVNLYSPILPICTSEKVLEKKRQPPELSELQLHQSTVWLWNRPVYDSTDNGHLRIEMRALPSGPTSIDMIANAAFLIGLAEGHREQINEILPAIPFQTAEYNFYRSAQYSLDANLIWPNAKLGYKRQCIIDIIDDNLPIAEKGLASIGIETDEINNYLSIIQQRISRKQNGAIWQKKMLNKLNQRLDMKASLHEMLELFIKNSQRNIPVAEWEIK